MKKFIPIIAIVILAGITAASVYMYIASEQEKNTLMNSLKQMEMQTEALEADKQALARELSVKTEAEQNFEQKKEELEKSLQSCEDRLTELDDNARKTQKTLDLLTTDAASLKTEVASLKTENAYLKTTNNSLSSENAALKAEKANPPQ